MSVAFKTYSPIRDSARIPLPVGGNPEPPDGPPEGLLGDGLKAALSAPLDVGVVKVEGPNLKAVPEGHGARMKSPNQPGVAGKAPPGASRRAFLSCRPRPRAPATASSSARPESPRRPRVSGAGELRAPVVDAPEAPGEARPATGPALEGLSYGDPNRHQGVGRADGEVGKAVPAPVHRKMPAVNDQQTSTEEGHQKARVCKVWVGIGGPGQLASDGLGRPGL